MEVKIGVQHAPRELTVDSAQTADDVERIVAEALESGGPIVLVDTKGRRTIVPGDRLAYLEIGSPSVGTVGFR